MIRKADNQDIDEIRLLAMEAWKYTYKNIYKEEKIIEFVTKYYSNEFHFVLIKRNRMGLHPFFVMEIENKIIGLIDFDFRGEETVLTRFYLHPNYIGRGFGKKLLNHGENVLKTYKRFEYNLMVHSQNSIGIDFYERNGFVRFPEKDDNEENDIGYKKVLV